MNKPPFVLLSNPTRCPHIDRTNTATRAAYYAWLGLPEGKTVNPVTSPPGEPSYSSPTGRQYRPPLEGKQMFKIEKTNYVVLAVLLFALVAAVVR